MIHFIPERPPRHQDTKEHKEIPDAMGDEFVSPCRGVLVASPFFGPVRFVGM
jgi:hypothetical protein